MKHPIENGACYVAHQGIAPLYEMFGGRTKLDMYPETGMSLFERQCGVVFKQSIVTESVQIISCYDRSDVYIWRDGGWVNPNAQTYGTSYNILSNRILGFKSNIPISIMSHKMIKIVEDKIKAFYV